MSKEFYEQTGVAMTCRSYREYADMFALEPADLEAGPILDVAGGASSFAAGAGRNGFEVMAADPQYAMSRHELEKHGREEIETSTAKLKGLAHQYDWSYYGSLDAHRANREQSLSLFLADFEREGERRYKPASLPKLPFEDEAFSLVLCSHFLFLYNRQLDYDFHLAAVRELIRLLRPEGQLRIYPLVDLHWQPYPHLEKLLTELEGEGISSRTARSGLPFIPGSDSLLVLTKNSGKVLGK
ncbi:methyltransferase domain-containing protein [Paenibacillus aurantius]|uniref:Methyltransferase domain-containing protein n=1 Tax=Paenibacillus aurantius TaxID=2918900 RepID=A0AA96LDN0_9BACL|nr:methyltransferase domain-containing protein [Paenibacillus aurantius]WNQ09767.1 methyltransferase domain-containing protein [Paenibacillus aurantius]